MSKLLDRIVDGGLCQGCGACAAVIGPERLRMGLSPEGYLRPQRISPSVPEEETLVESVCSGYSLAHDTTSESYDDTWGPIREVGIGYAQDPETRFRGSSGGVISALATHLIETGRVDFVLQTAASESDPIANETRPSPDRSSVLQAAGSRYGPSSPLQTVAAHLSSGRRFAFVGRPCDVAALRRWAKVDDRIDRQIPLMISFFCAGIPSRRGTLAVLDALGVKFTELTQFAYRGNGWPGVARAVRADGSESTMDYNTSWGSILNRHLQFRCKICPDGTGEFADIVCADAWHSDDGYPNFDEADGLSLVVARSAAGSALLASALTAKAVNYTPADLHLLPAMQPYQHERKRAIVPRISAMIARGRLAPRYSGLRIFALARRCNPVWLLRNFTGTYRRLSRSDQGSS